MPVLRYLGLAKEADFAGAAPPVAVFHVDIASASLDAPMDTELIYSGGLGRGRKIHRPGFYAPSGDIAYAFDIRTIGWLLRWALDGYKYTPQLDPALDIHEIWGSDSSLLPSFCARLGKDLFEHVFSGCTIGTLTITVEGEFCTVTATINAAKDAKEAIKAKSALLLPSQYPLAFHEVTATIAGADSSAKVKSLTLTIENALAPDAGRSIGSRHPRRIPAGERAVNLSANLFFEDTAELERFWGGAAGPAATGVTEFAVELNFDAGVDGFMVIALPKVIYNQVQQQPSGRDEITQAVGGMALLAGNTLNDAVTEVESELLVTINNNEVNMT